jgi:hypothetical protein
VARIERREKMEDGRWKMEDGSEALLLSSILNPRSSIFL